MTPSFPASHPTQPPSGGFHLVGGRTLALVLALLLLTACAPANAPTPATELPPAVVRAAGTASVHPGNYCVSCHTAGDERLAHALDWAGGIEQEAITPCPAVVQARQEVYYTERLLLAIERLQPTLPRGAARDRLESQVAAARQTYSRLLDSPPTSLDAFTSEAQSLRYRLGKVYAGLGKLDAAARRDRVLIVAAFITLFLLISLAWGWRNTLRSTQYAVRGSLRPQSLIPNLLRSWRALVLVALTLVFFSLPLFRVPTAEVAMPGAEEQARQTALDTATRIASVADRGYARAWMLGRVAAEMATSNRELGETALAEALAAADSIRADAAALWGEGQAVQEAAVGSLAAQEKSLLIADALAAAQNRVWPLRLVAEEWLAIDPQRAEAILQQALASASNRQSSIPDTFSALDLRGLAVTWARINKARGLEVAGQIADPALRAWAYREIAAFTGDAALFRQAADAARAIPDPVERSRALREIAARTGDSGLWGEALAVLAGVPEPARSYALANLVRAGYPDALNQISADCPTCRVVALVALRREAEALAEAARIADPVDRAHAEAAIAVMGGNTDLARRITDPTIRDRALRDIAIATRDATLAAGISSPYERVQALTALQQYAAALAEADNLRDTRPLVPLAIAWARSDPQAALAIVDRIEREADKAEVLRAIAAATGDPVVFERALGMALAARVRGDALAPAEASLALARQVKDRAAAGQALAQALDIAQKITIKYK